MREGAAVGWTRRGEVPLPGGINARCGVIESAEIGRGARPRAKGFGSHLQYIAREIHASPVIHQRITHTRGFRS